MTSTPKAKRGKRLHIVTFVDAAKTKSMSISIKLLFTLCVLLFGFFSIAAASMIFYSKNLVKLREAQKYILELKASLVSQAVVSQNLLSEGYSSQNAPIWQKIAAVTNAIQKPKAPAAHELAAVELQAVNLPSVDPRAPALVSTPIDFAPPKIPTPHSTNAENTGGSQDSGPTHSTATSSERTEQIPPDNNTTDQKITFDNINTSPNGTNKTDVEFELVNSDLKKAEPTAGRVCLVAELITAQGETIVMTYPENLKLKPDRTPVSRCKGGQLVRFARLRPTTVTLKTAENNLHKFTLFFAETGGSPLVRATHELPK